MTPNSPETPNEDSSAKAEATFFRPHDELHIHRGNLPHWRQNNVTYFVTTRLADSMPQEKLREWQTKRDAWLAAHGLQKPSDIHQLPEDQQHEFHTTFTKEWHQWLDSGYGECQLRRPEVRDILIKRLHAEPSLDAWVIMPNHLHALVAPENQGLGDVLQNWKGGSAFEINRLLGRSGPLSSGPRPSFNTTDATSPRTRSRPVWSRTNTRRVLASSCSKWLRLWPKFFNHLEPKIKPCLNQSPLMRLKPQPLS